MQKSENRGLSIHLRRDQLPCINFQTEFMWSTGQKAIPNRITTILSPNDQNVDGIVARFLQYYGIQPTDVEPEIVTFRRGPNVKTSLNIQS